MTHNYPVPDPIQSPSIGKKNQVQLNNDLVGIIKKQRFFANLYTETVILRLQIWGQKPSMEKQRSLFNTRRTKRGTQRQ
jgi:hypothetical protein